MPTGLTSLTGRRRIAARGATLAAGIVVSGLLGQATAVTASKTSLIWLPTGIAVALLFRWGVGFWPAAYLGILLVQSLGHGPGPAAFATAATGTLGTSLAAAMLRRAQIDPAFGRWRDVLALVAAGMVGMAVTASGGVFWLWAAGAVPASSAPAIWCTWWRGDFAGVLLAAPFLISLSRETLQPLLDRRVETVAFAAASAAIAWVINVHWERPGEPIGAVILIIWAAMRYGILGSSLTAFACSVHAAYAIALGFGSFASESSALFSLWIYLITWSSISLLIGVVRASAARDQEILESNLQRLNETTAELVAGKARLEATIEQLQISEQEAERANRVKTQFLANMSHELRTPVAALLGYGEMLAQAAAATRHGREALDGIRRNGAHLLGLIDDVLDIARIESGRIDLAAEPYDPARIVDEVALLTSLYARSRGVALSCRASRNLPGLCRLDPMRLRQVLANLVNNAVKFSPAKAPVTLDARFDAEPPTLVFDVVDRGIGISEENQRKLFRPFFQVDDSMTRKFGGTGLGLSLSARFVEAMGGSIRVESAEGRGSRFTVAIPARDVVDREPGGYSVEADPVSSRRPPPTLMPPPAPPPAPEPASSTKTARGRVLMVEDCPDIRTVVAFLLGRSGLDVAFAEDGAAGAELGRSREFDLILMDMHLPGRDGLDVVRALRDEGVATPILALTAANCTGDRDRAIAAGCNGFLSKPVAGKTLLDAVNLYIRPEKEAI